MSHTIKGGTTLQVRVISSQHCIEVEGEQIELIYIFSENLLQVHFNDRMIISTQMAVNKTQVNYANLIEVATTYFMREIKRMKQELKELEKASESELPQREVNNFKEYIMNSITTVIE